VPILEFLVAKNQLTYMSEDGREEWLLVPSAEIVKSDSFFEIRAENNVFDGFSFETYLTIQENNEENIARVKEVCGYALEELDEFHASKVSRVDLGTLVIGNVWDEEESPFFQVKILLPRGTIFNINNLLENNIAYLDIDTYIFGPGLKLKHSDELEWNADKANVAIIESVSLRFKDKTVFHDKPGP